MRNRLLGTALATAVLGIGAVSAQAQGIRVTVDGDPIQFNGVGPREMNGRVLVPLRGVLEELGAYVEYDVASRSVIASRGDLNLELGLGETFATVNGQRVNLDVPAMTMAGSTMVPLRFVSEALGARVRWNPYNSTVAIRTDGTAVADSDQPRNRAFRRPRAGMMPVVTSVSTNLTDGWVDPGDIVRVTMRATPGGTGWFRIHGLVGQIKMKEIEPGLYEGYWRATAGSGHVIDDDDILAFVVVGDRATAERHP